MSDSEQEYLLPKASTSRKAAAESKKSPSATKRKPTTDEIKRDPKKKNLDVFGIGIGQSTDSGTEGLSSYIVSRVAEGIQRKTKETWGEFYVELKVYLRSEAEAAKPEERWKKALLRLYCELDPDTPQWTLLQKFVREADLLFDVDPTFSKFKK